MFDVDGSGTVSLAEFMETMARFSGTNLDSKIEFLFKVQLRNVVVVFISNQISGTLSTSFAAPGQFFSPGFGADSTFASDPISLLKKFQNDEAHKLQR